MQYQYIKTNEALAAFCAKAKTKQAIAIDTEFVRTRTFYPQIGLIQAYDGEQLVLIDPLEIDQFDCLKALLIDENVTKILHSCSEDLEVFWRYFTVIPKPLFDSQIAAALCNMGNALGYAKLVEVMLEVSLDKGESRADWLARPLTDKQCQYAANDVVYLMQLYPMLLDKVTAIGRLNWVFDEVLLLTNKKEFQLPSEWTYLTIKHNWLIRGKSLLMLKKLAQWRVEKARAKDVALNFIIRESCLVEIAKRKPKGLQNLKGIERLGPIEIRRYGEEILAIVSSCEACEQSDYPLDIQRLTDFPKFKGISKALRSFCEEKSQELDIPIELLASKRQVSQLLKWLWFEHDETRILGLVPDFLMGWRQQILQKELEQLCGVELK
jgi:ribonuclease D